MPDWEFNDPIDVGFDCFYLYTLRKLEKAGWERIEAAVIDYFVIPGFEDNANPVFVSDFNIGDDVQEVSNLSLLKIQNFAHAGDYGEFMEPGFSVLSLNPVTDPVSSFLTFDFSDPFVPNTINLPKALRLAGYADPDFIEYRRQMPRTVDNDESLFDQNANPAAIGQTALVMGFADGDYAGQIRQFDGATWSIKPGVDVLPDHLDSHYGNHYADISDPPSDDRQCFPSALGTIGEFISHKWIFEQPRNVAKQYKTALRYHDESTGTPTGSLGNGFDSVHTLVTNTDPIESHETTALAIAQVEADWPGTPDEDYFPGRYTQTWSDFGGSYRATAVAGYGKFEIRNFAGRPKSVDMYAVVVRAFPGGDESTFDDQGEGVTETEYNNFFTSAASSDEFTRTDNFPTQLLAIPPNWPSDSGFTKGFFARDFVAIINWDFEFQ